MASLNELEQRIAVLTRQNFDLKMQIYYLQQSRRLNIEDENVLNELETTPSVEEFHVEINQKNEEIGILKQRIIDLEMELKSRNEENQLEENINVKARVARVICDFDNQEISRLNELVESMKEEIVELQSYNAAIKDEARHINNVSINSEMIISEKDSIIQKLKYLLKVNNISEDTISAIESISSTTPVVSTPAISTQHDTSNNGNSTIQQLKEDNQKLLELLERERMFIKSQEETLKQMKASNDEIILLEATEISRLSSELDRHIEEKRKWQLQYKTLEEKNKLLKNRLEEIENDKNNQFNLRLTEDVENAFYFSNKMKSNFSNTTVSHSSPSASSSQIQSLQKSRNISPADSTHTTQSMSDAFSVTSLQTTNNEEIVKKLINNEQELIKSLEVVCRELERSNSSRLPLQQVKTTYRTPGSNNKNSIKKY
jgi:hypothetical protein